MAHTKAATAAAYIVSCDGGHIAGRLSSRLGGISGVFSRSDGIGLRRVARRRLMQ